MKLEQAHTATALLTTTHKDNAVKLPIFPPSTPSDAQIPRLVDSGEEAVIAPTPRLIIADNDDDLDDDYDDDDDGDDDEGDVDNGGCEMDDELDDGEATTSKSSATRSTSRDSAISVDEGRNESFQYVSSAPLSRISGSTLSMSQPLQQVQRRTQEQSQNQRTSQSMAKQPLSSDLVHKASSASAENADEATAPEQFVPPRPKSAIPGVRRGKDHAGSAVPKPSKKSSPQTANSSRCWRPQSEGGTALAQNAAVAAVSADALRPERRAAYHQREISQGRSHTSTSADYGRALSHSQPSGDNSSGRKMGGRLSGSIRRSGSQEAGAAPPLPLALQDHGPSRCSNEETALLSPLSFHGSSKGFVGLKDLGSPSSRSMGSQSQALRRYRQKVSYARYGPDDRRLFTAFRLNLETGDAASSTQVLQPRCGQAAVVTANGQIYVYGGQREVGCSLDGVTATSKRVVMCALADGSMGVLEEATALEPLSGHSIVSIDEDTKLLIYGGSTGEKVPGLFSNVWVVDLQANSTFALQVHGQLPARSVRQTACVYGDCLWVFGGEAPRQIRQNRFSVRSRGNPLSNADGSFHYSHEGGRCSSELWCLDLCTTTWANVYPAVPDALWPSSRAGHSACVWSDYLYIYGGHDGAKCLADVWRYCFLSHKWDRVDVVGTPPGERHGAASVLVEDRWIVYGGINAEGALLHDLVEFNLCLSTSKRTRVEIAGSASKLLPALAYATLMPELRMSGAVNYQSSLSPAASPLADFPSLLLFGGVTKKGVTTNAVFRLIRKPPEAVTVPEGPQLMIRTLSKDEQVSEALVLSHLGLRRSPLDPVMEEPDDMEDRQSSARGTTDTIDARPREVTTQSSTELRAHSGEAVRPASSSMSTNASMKTTPHNNKNNNSQQLPPQSLKARELQRQVEYLEQRLKEEKEENQMLRTLARSVAALRKTNSDLETELLIYRQLRIHPTLGEVLEACVKSMRKEKHGSSIRRSGTSDSR